METGSARRYPPAAGEPITRQRSLDQPETNLADHGRDLALRSTAPERWRRYAARAASHTLSARSSRDQGYTRSRIFDEIRLAKVRLAQREPVESVAVARTSLRLAEPVRSSLVVDWLVRFNGELLARHPDCALFRERFDVQRRQEGFTLVTAGEHGHLVGFGFGVTLQPTTPWRRNLLAPLPDDLTAERPGRTWALVELLVRAPWRRQHVAQTIHDTLLTDRSEERATLTVLPTAAPAVAAYRTWGWTQVGQKRNPLPGAPVFAVMLKGLRV